MQQEHFSFSTKNYTGYFNADFSFIEKLVPKENAVILTDKNIAVHYSHKFISWRTIVIEPGESNKQQATADFIIGELIRLKADRDTIILGVGGGVITDITGYVASIFMRGIKFALVPTTILAMVDAAVGGKNGVDVGIYKNLVGTIKHPEFLFYDYSFLRTLPDTEWVNGFAEIIKHACIQDNKLFGWLERQTLHALQSSVDIIDELIRRNVEIKYNIVSGDEFEKGDRRLLNFGHTLGHAIENIYKLSHGNAVSIGMVAACAISEEMNNFPAADKLRVISLLQKYQLPATIDFDKEKIWEVLLMDKKKAGNKINFVLLTDIGHGVVLPIALNQLKELFSICL
ncbi:MAG: 3-dehydroquinate synthase [Ginsengibacter sp.]